MSLYHILLLPVYLWLGWLLLAIIYFAFVAILAFIAQLFSPADSDEASDQNGGNNAGCVVIFFVLFLLWLLNQ